MKRRLLIMMLGMATMGVFAQRQTDNLDRGLVAVSTSKGVFCSWRIPAGEYYDVTYNIYRDGTKLNSTPLTVSNYTDKAGSATSKYAVEVVVRGKAQAKCSEVTPWAKNYLEIKMDHGSLTSAYVPNDACCADVDGDGELEILLKFDNISDGGNGYKPAGYNGEYAIAEVYKLNGKKLWWLDYGPNMGDFQNNENNIVAFDWNEDGKAEALLRAADGTTLHTANGDVVVIGDKSKNYRPEGGMSGQWFMHEGAEYLLYLNGETGEVYDKMDFPLKRLESGETDLAKAWGDGYGHRSSKYFYGAPYLDGKHPSVFLARGIYTRHKMIAFDVDKSTNKLKERWRWNCSDAGSAWYGQGYHNFGVADVDWDGRDEIVYGSMVIDDNGKGLSTTGLGHGDAQHCGDFDPYTHGQEIFACNETRPGNNFRDATTSKIYYRFSAGNDDGRAMMGNFVDEIPGAQGISSRDGALIGGAAHGAVDGYTKGSFNITQNFRIYWDGDLCEETFDYSNGKNTAGHIMKAKVGEIALLEGSMTNNDTKGTPDYQGDIFGDWREEVIMRTEDNNIRIYTTTDESPWRNYSLWHDHQYRNAMVWQMCGYNQPPHVSYFLGEKEGITIAPPPLTTAGRTEVANNATIGTEDDDLHILLDETNDMTVNVTDGAKPYILTDNAPTWVQGHGDNDNITTTTYTHTLTGGAFAGAMRLVKQGDGTLVLPNVTEKYTGSTDVWAGTLSFDGTMESSRVWLNRHTTLLSNGGKFMKSLEADYNATIYPGGKDSKGTIEADSLIMNFGSRLVIDIYSDGMASDQVKANVLKIGTVDWTNGPKYSAPVIQFAAHLSDSEDRLAAGKYLIGEIGKIEGDINDIKIEGLTSMKANLIYENGKLYAEIPDLRSSAEITWNGNADVAGGNVWDVSETENFKGQDGSADIFVLGDVVVFDDNAATGNVSIATPVKPKSVVFNNNTLEYTITGDSIIGAATLVKNGTQNVTIANDNRFTGGTTINEGTLTVDKLANNIGVAYGALGDVDAPITINNAATFAVSSTMTTAQPISIGEGGATIETLSGAALTIGTSIKSSVKGPLYKKGSGSIALPAGNTFGKVYLNQGTINAPTDGTMCFPNGVVFNGNGVTLAHDNTTGSYSSDYTNYEVPADKVGNLYLDGRCEYFGSLSGEGTLNIYPRFSRNYLSWNVSKFTGKLTIKAASYSANVKSLTDLSNCTVNVESGATFSNDNDKGGNVAVTLGSISGTGTFAGGGTYTIGGNDADIDFEGQFTSPVKKTGSGTWTITSKTVQDNIGAVTIEGGILSLQASSSSTSSVLGSNAVTVKSGATINGVGYVSSLSLTSGAKIVPGNPKSTKPSGTIGTVNGMTIASGADAEFFFRNAKNNKLYHTFFTVGGRLTMNGTVKVTLDSSYTPAIGDELTLWSCTAFSGKPSFDLPALPDGMAWDTSGVAATTGVLRVVEGSTGIASAKADVPVRCRLFSLGGTMLAEYYATEDNSVSHANSLGMETGSYVLLMGEGSSAKSIKIAVK